jgi:hypothetical protein
MKGAKVFWISQKGAGEITATELIAVDYPKYG